MTNIMRRSGFNIAAGLVLAAIFSMPLFAEFTNDSFETGDFTGWTKSSYLNTGLVGNQPYSGASRTMTAGGSTAESVIITSPTESGVDPIMGAAATLRFPKFGSRVARVNDTTAIKHSNTITQRSTMTVSDIDPVDGKLHIRFAVAPIVKKESHLPAASAYFYVAVRNVTRGNALLYESLHYANEPGYAWKLSPNGAAYYTDWQLVDIAPGDSSLAVGDVFTMEVSAAGCGPSGGHYGYAYVDSFNQAVPGLFVEAVADKVLVSTGEVLTYTFTYRNGGTAAVDNVVVKENIPAAALFSSLSDAVNCSTSGSVVTCNFGTMAAGGSGTFQVSVVVRSTATTSVDNGNYYIQGSSYTPLLGPVVSVPIKGPPTNLAMLKTASAAQVNLNSLFTYRLSVTNKGPNAANNVVVIDTLPAGVEFSSAAAGQGVCLGASVVTCKLGTIASLATSTMTITVRAVHGGYISNTASVSGSFDDTASVDNSSSTVILCPVAPQYAPAGLAATAQGVSSITWSWSSVEYATSYLFYPSTGGPAIPVAGLSLTLTGLSPNTDYSGHVSALNVTGEGPASAAAMAYTLPLPPAGTQALVLSSAAVRVQWTDTGAAAYEVERSTLPGSDFVIAGSSNVVGAAVLFDDQGLDPAATYYYRVRAYNGDGLPGAYDAVVSTETYPAPPAAPGTPVLTVYLTSVTFTWASVSGADSYLFYPSSGGPAIPLTGTSLTLTDLSTNTFYGGQVSAVNISGEGPLSASGAAYTLALPPAGTQALLLSSAAINVQWTSTGGTAYEVERSTLPGSGFVIAGSSAVVGAAALYADQGLDPATTYYYRVRAYNGDGVPSDYDAIASTETYAGPPGAPVMAAFTVSSDTFRWYWTPSGGQADSFTLYSATGTVIAVLPGSVNYYLETNVSSVTLTSRYLMAVNHSGQAFSPIVTVATPYLQSFFTGTSTSPLVGIDGQTGLIVPLSLMGNTTTWLISEDPLQGPLMSNTTSLIVTAGWPVGMQGATISLTEYLVAVDGNRYTGTLNPPVTVSVPYTDSNFPGYVDGTWPRVPVSSLALYVLDETTGLWILVPGSAVDTVKKVVTGTIDHLSIFMAFGSGAAGDLSSVRVYPIPYRPNGSADQGGGDTGIVFDNLTQSVKIKIYTVTGRLVASFGTEASSGALRWNVHNESGQPVTSGGYIAVITAPNVPKTIKKILVVR